MISLKMSDILPIVGWEQSMLWLPAFMQDHRQSVIDFALDCAESVLPIWEEWAKQHAPEHKDAPRQAIAAARSGEAVEEAIKFASEAARVAGDAAYAASKAQTTAGTASASKQYSKICLAADVARAAAKAAAKAAQASCVKEANAAAGYARNSAYFADFIQDIGLAQRLIKHFG
jgi:DNA repair photolyase